MKSKPTTTAFARRWVWLNALSITFSLAHILLDWHIGLFGQSATVLTAWQAALPWLLCLLYAWWGVSLALAGRDVRSGYASLLVLNAGWAFAGNGLPILACLPPCSGAYPHSDIAHIGNLIFGVWAAIELWRLMRRDQQALPWSLPLVAFVLIVALFVVESSLAKSVPSSTLNGHSPD